MWQQHRSRLQCISKGEGQAARACMLRSVGTVPTDVAGGAGDTMLGTQPSLLPYLDPAAASCQTFQRIECVDACIQPRKPAPLAPA